MGFLDSIKKGFAMEDEERPIPNTLDELVRTSGSSEAGRGRVIVVEPMRMEECNALVECIRHGLVVIINTEKLEEEFSRRIVDFLTGATRAIDGRSLKINRTTYIFAPSDIDVAIRRKDKKPVEKVEKPEVQIRKETPMHRVVPDETANIQEDEPEIVKPEVVSHAAPSAAPNMAPSVAPKEEDAKRITSDTILYDGSRNE